MNSRTTIIFLTIFIIFSISLNFTFFGQIINLKTLDLFTRGHSPHPDIVVLAIDNKSLNFLGRWPWSRKIHSQILQKLETIKPQVVGMDIIFSETENDQTDEEFSKSIGKASFHVVLAGEAVFLKGSDQPQRLVVPLSKLMKNQNASLGLTNLEIDTDGVVRSFPKAITIGNQTYLPFSLQLAEILKVDPNFISDASRKSYLVNLAGSAGSFPIYSISDFLQDKVPKEKLSGKIILIGATASDLHDTVLTSQKKPIVSGVEFNANLLDNILLQRQITLLPKIMSFILGSLIGITYLLVFSKISDKNLSILLITSSLAFPLISFVLWQMGLALTYFSNLILCFITFVFNALFGWFKSVIEKRRLKKTFEHYFSPQVMQEILKNPQRLKLGGQRVTASVLFSDIRNFTTITEKLKPEKLTNLLHEYFTHMSSEILATDGVLDKFIGDAIMAFWGAPIEQKDHADRAVITAINMNKRLKKLQKKWLRIGYPFVDAGIGINSGAVTVGNMGSQDRFDYTVIGDGVNIASRLEGLNKEFKSNIIISQATKDALTIPIKSKFLGEVQVKGKTVPLKIYQVILN